HILDHIISKHHGCKDRSYIASEKVGAHSGNISYVVSHVICNGRRISWVILRDPGFHFPNEVGTHVGCLCINTPTHSGEKGYGFSAQGETRKSFQDDGHLMSVGPFPAHKIMEEED